MCVPSLSTRELGPHFGTPTVSQATSVKKCGLEIIVDYNLYVLRSTYERTGKQNTIKKQILIQKQATIPKETSIQIRIFK